MTPPRAYIYARHSVEGADSITRQVEDCESLAAREGCTVVRTITDDDTSASSRKPRKGYAELIRDVEAGAVDVILAQTQDRLLRKPREMEDLIDLVEKTRVRVVLHRAMFDLTTAMGRANARQAAVWAATEVDIKSERQRRQQRQAAERGAPSGRRAFGYKANGLEVEPGEAAVVREAFDRLLNRGHSVSELTRWMNTTGLLTAAQRKPWDTRGVAYMLLSPRYAGIRHYRKGRDDGIVVDGTWPKLITVDQHEKAVKLLTDPVRRTTPGNARKHLGSGLFLCGCPHCDGRETVRTVMRHNGRRTYACRNHHLIRPADPVDQLVLGVVEGYLARPDGPAALLAARDVPEVGELRAERDDLQARIEKYRDQLDRGVIEEDDYLPLKRAAQAKIAVVERRLAAAAKTSQLAGLAAASDPVAMFRDLGLSLRREIIDKLVKVTLLPAGSSSPMFDPSRIRIEWR